jgi:group I intron endonuclease
MNSGIYKITNSINGKFYIGSSVDIRWRWYTHKYELSKGTHSNKYLQNAWNKYGEESFEFSIISFVKKNLLIDKEQQILNETKCYQREVGYNISRIANSPFLGRRHTEESKRKISKSKLGKPRSEETKRKLSEAQKGKTIPQETRDKISKTLKGRPSPMKGRKASKETREKMSKSLKGIKKSEEWRRKIGDAQRGANNHASKLTEEQVIEIKKELLSNEKNRSQSAIAIEYGVSPVIISQIKTGKRWSHIEVKQ